MITLYDIPSKLEGKIWSSNTIKARSVLYSRSPKSTTLVTLMQKHLAQYLIEHRIALNYKRLPYRTE